MNDFLKSYCVPGGKHMTTRLSAMFRYSVVLAVFWCCLNSNAQPFDFKGVPLGISKADFRMLPHPDGVASAVKCTEDDSGILSGLYVLRPNLKYRDAGLTECMWFTKDTESYGDSWKLAKLKMAASGHEAEPTLLFTPDEDGVSRLFRVTVSAEGVAAGDILKALTKRWGEPTVGLREDSREIYSELPEDLRDLLEPTAKGSYMWLNDFSSILLLAQFGETSLMFLHHDLQRTANRRFDEVLARMKNPI